MKKKIKINVWACQCERCGNKWHTRSAKVPKACPDCKTPLWDTPYKNTEK